MHRYGDKGVDWRGIYAAAEFIANYLVKYGRINVRDYKEKYGTVRVYLSFGWYQLHAITHPRHVYSVYPRWLWKLDCQYLAKLIRPFNKVVVPYHVWLYKRAYKLAIKKWPHLKKEILCAADYGDLLVALKKRF